MQIPTRIPGLRLLIVLWGVTAVGWSFLEGDLRRLLPFALFTTLTGLAVLFQRFMGGRRFTAVRGVVLMGLFGLALGAGTVLMAVLLMAVKTGLHAHGPEFTMAEIAGVWQQLPFWSLAGLLAGLGLGLLLLARPVMED